MKRVGENWDVEDLIDHEWVRAGMTENGLKVLVPKVVGEYLPRDGDVLELGCGLGALYSMLSNQDRIRLKMLDQNAEALEVLKSRHADAKVVNGSAYQLPFANGTFLAVVGLNLLDFMVDLDAVLQEIRRVLSPNGRLLHIMELAPYLRNVFFDIGDDEWAFPVLDNTRLIGMKMVKKKDVLSLPAFAVDDNVKVLDLIHEDLETNYVLLEQERTPLFKQLASIADNIDGRTILLKDSFINRVGKYLICNDFETVFNGGQDVYAPLPPDVVGLLPDGEGCHFDMGYTHPLKLFIAGDTRMKYTFHVTVAQKT